MSSIVIALRAHRGLAALALLSLAASLMGCSVVLAPSRHQTGGAVDANRDLDAGPGHDGGPGHDASLGDADLGDTGIETDAAVAPDTGVDAGPSCPSSLECVPAAPLGWSGPIVFVTGPGDLPSPSCPGTAPSTAFTARSGLTASDAACGCTCTPPTAGLSCGSASIQSTNSTCITVGTNVSSFTDGACHTVSLPSSGGWTLTTPAFSSGSTSCTPAPSTDIAPITWDASHRACGFGTPTSCGTESVCAPARGANERLCVYVDGDATCPAGFPDPIATADDATDTRGCSACTCGGVTGSCGGSISITNGCPGTIFVAEISVGGCTPAMSTTGVSGTADFVPTASCPPSTTAPTGAVTPTIPRTVCCLAD